MSQQAQTNPLLTFLQLEKEARHAATFEDLTRVIVNRTRAMVPYRQAVLAVGGVAEDVAVQAASDVAVLDKDAPYIRWCQSVIKEALSLKREEPGVFVLEAEAMPASLREDWQEWLPKHVLFCPVVAPRGRVVGVLLLARDQAWTDQDKALLNNITDCWGHAWLALTGTKVLSLNILKRRKVWLSVAVAAILVQFIPVPQSILAPAEVTARHPYVIAAPIDGVIKSVLVEPNQSVQVGERLMHYEDADILNRLKVATEALVLAETELRTARQAAFLDREGKAKIRLLEAQVKLKEAERAQITSVVERLEIKTARPGVAVFRAASDIEGRSVQTGERLMLVANPRDTEVTLEVAVADAIALDIGAPVKVFLDKDPLHPIEAKVIRASYEATPRADGNLAYSVFAAFNEATEQPRLGLRGTAKVSGTDVPLFYYLFRRPLTAARQFIGY